jgi:RIO-like serine/threonine protein kinase
VRKDRKTARKKPPPAMEKIRVELSPAEDIVLQTIYEETRRSATGCVPLRFIEVTSGISAYELRNITEDLKNARLIVEHEEGLRVTDLGLFESKARWA